MLARKRLIGVLMVLLLASAGLTTWVATRDEPAVVIPKVGKDGKYRVGTVGSSAEVAAVKAASTAMTVALSYDYRSLDKSLAASLKLMTPAFAKDFSSIFKKTTMAMATEKQAIASALVRGAGIVDSVHDGKATVLVYLDQVLISSKAKKPTDPPEDIQTRVDVSMRKVDGRWLVSNIDPF